MIKYCYTLKDVLALVTPRNTQPLMYDKDKIVTLLDDCVEDETSSIQNQLSLHQIDVRNLLFNKYQLPGGIVINPTPYSKLINIIKNRYQTDYILRLDEPIKSPLVDNKELVDWCDKFFEILVSTKDKYYNILTIYDEQLSKLMNPLKTSHLGSGNTSRHEDYDTDMSGKNLLNDTPQTSDVVATIEQDQYVSELSKSTAHTDNVGDVSEARQEAFTTEVDTMTAMARIDEIQEKYQMLLRKWSNEFSGLFMEEV